MNFPLVKISLIQKKKLKTFNLDKLREECGIFGISNHTDAAAACCFRTYMLYNTEDKKVVE